VTFGAPMVLYGEDANKLYAGLQKLEAAAEAAAGKAGHPPLHFHNFVCGSDIVPRLDLRSMTNHNRPCTDSFVNLTKERLGGTAAGKAGAPAAAQLFGFRV